MSFSFFLVTEASFHASYLITRWIEAFECVEGFRGIVVREEPMPEEEQRARELFHHQYQGQMHLSNAAMQQLRASYPDLSETEQAMISLFGVSRHSVTHYPGTVCLGFDLNAPQARQWLVEVCAAPDHPFLFVFLDQILEPWWIELSGSRIINGHSAVLPYARGMFAIENVAISQSVEAFKRAAGATVHYIDSGIDTGPIIRAERLIDPFRFGSIWEQKGYTFSIVFDLLIQVAKGMCERPDTIPVGTSTAPALRGRNFNRRDFTQGARQRAERGYLKMKTMVAR